MPLLEEAIAMAKKRTIRELENSGRIGKEEVQEHIALEFTHFFDKLIVNSKTPYEPFSERQKLHSIGHTCTVYWDGKPYVCKTEHLEDYSDGFFTGIGNCAKYRNEGDTGEPFLLRLANSSVYDPNNPPTYNWRLYCYDEYPATHTFKIVDEVTVITTPISDKYLPGVCLPVVELTTQIPNDGSPVQFTAEENEAFEKAALSGMPAVIRFTFSFDVDMVVQMASVGNRIEMYQDGPGQIIGFRVHTDAETNFVFQGIAGHWGGSYMPTE